MPATKDAHSVRGANSTPFGGIMSVKTQAGTAELQGRLWSVNPADWAGLREAKRVSAPGGRILALVWSPPEMCELAPHLQSLGALMPPPPPGAPGPFALSGRDALEDYFAAAGLEVAHIADVTCTFGYPDTT